MLFYLPLPEHYFLIIHRAGVDPDDTDAKSKQKQKRLRSLSFNSGSRTSMSSEIKRHSFRVSTDNFHMINIQFVFIRRAAWRVKKIKQLVVFCVKFLKLTSQ